ncbi:cytochrome ubiquinol oxidase subunit I [Desulfolithobacter dissulfuricans]|uniref:Cytochrome ubiquinol oxidase subunit I n=1 Tax=Desulfolithobacter dissulfuricans TaxID=2795293 RepID=A0A915UB39_9BACT|nr:cytochrome ubiquinol oxidase subunit I [Desulfolithobacter dissulfuricans]BCO10596.1 cytochrome ubiquinol oxidase subunit I [Desulfolithobacter dissulfuricans]
MIENFDMSMVNWARAQFALTAMYHWIFVPLTLGITWIIAFYETLYVKTGNEHWKHITKFWAKLFGINFAIGVATGIIMEFEFGTNWSNYSWMVGDIFGAPLAIEGIIAFFLEATFFAVMFFGWNRVSKRFHLFSTWMVALGSNLSAMWILVANGWMQFPTGMAFNPDTARFEMQNIMEVILSPVAVSKFTHTTSSSMLLASLFIISISSWFLLRGRHIEMAKRSIIVAAVFGLITSAVVGFTGDEAAYEDAQHQPMKLAAFEGLYKGEKNAGIVAIGMLNSDKKPGDDQKPFNFQIRIPALLSLLANRSPGSFVPGIDDLVYGNEEYNIMGAGEKIERGKIALSALDTYKKAKKEGNGDMAAAALASFNENQEYMGYGFLEKPEDIVPPVATTFYSFHIMVALGTLFPLVCLAFLYFTMKDQLLNKRWLLAAGVPMFFLAMIASQAGWVVAEVGRQPWAIQGLLPVSVARSNLTAGTVQTTFFMFAILFTILLFAEVRIMTKQISIGPEGE